MQFKRLKANSISILIVNSDLHKETATGRAVRALASTLEAESIGDGKVSVVLAATVEDATSLIRDATIQACIVDWDLDGGADHAAASGLLSAIRTRNAGLPVFLLAERTRLSEIPVQALQQADDFIWLLEDTVDFITGRITAAIKRYRDQLLPPMLRALVSFSELHEYSWHTPGHTGGTAFLKSPVGQAFYSFFGENLFRSDLSVSVAELGSLLDHSGPIGAGEAYAARVFGADRTYYVTNGTSTSNRVVVMAAITHGQIALCDRNCHKSIEHGMTLSGAVPIYLMPSRNHLGIIGPVHPDRLSADGIRRNIAANPLTQNAASSTPSLAILTNSTYDGLCYNIDVVEPALAASTDRILFDEAWFAYAKFHPIYAGRHAMRERKHTDGDDAGPTIFANQSTHKLLAALSQASMIHVRDGKRPIPHERFNEAFMMHASTSPQYAIIASNDVSAAMMDGPAGKALVNESILEAIAFRQMLARLQSEFNEKGEWFFGVWQPDTVTDESGLVMPFHKAPEAFLAADIESWCLAPNAAWHGFGALPRGYCMLDPIKVSVIAPGISASGAAQEPAIPAQLVSMYLDANGIIAEKTTDYTLLFLFSLGITKGKWGTLINALLDFKRDFEANAPLAHVLPELAGKHPKRYGKIGLADLALAMSNSMRTLSVTKCLEDAFAVLPIADCTPTKAYSRLVMGEVEDVQLNEMAGRTLATGIVPYPPGIPLLMPGENAGAMNGAALRYLVALEKFDFEFPEFSHDIHGVTNRDGVYHALCLSAVSPLRSAIKY
jgi:arginine decarboxylase